MRDFKFKTNIKCGGCIAAVTPFLDKVSGVEKWEVDTNVPEKILTVTGDLNNTESIENAVREAGYNIEKIT